LPVRNGAADLPGWFESVERFADLVLALDDGSTDDTAAVLESHPLVEVVLRNQQRATYRGWDDAGNRNRLLDAASWFNPDWVMWLDADEQLDQWDADALVRFVGREAVAGCAYGMRVYSMLQEPDSCEPTGLWVYRLFAFAPGQRLRPRRLHDVPVPTRIPGSRWVKTTLRIRHFGAMTGARRAARYAKYEEADPDRIWQSSYSHLLEPARTVLRWAPRAVDEPVLAQVSPIVRPVHDGPAPALSVVIVAGDDQQRIERCVRSVVEQECPEPFEVIVLVGGANVTASAVREKFPSVRVANLGSGVLPGATRNVGLLRARGEYVCFWGPHVEVAPGSLAGLLRAHREGNAIVASTVVNETPSAAGWASYFLDHTTALPGCPAALLNEPPARCSYARCHLFDVGGFREDLSAGEGTLVNRELWRRGHAYRALRFAALFLPKRLLTDSREMWRSGGPLRSKYPRVLPLVVLGALAAYAGLCLELARAAGSVAATGLTRASTGARSPQCRCSAWRCAQRGALSRS
jgi:glycosyltransferase involved in cell wall biosynthesis